ncbi:MAG: tRNA preQ1(34) S-adenosylmethionine ribosyltransferase-isomerase QueA [Bacteroidetes bacterium]|jgi:S-adenosylmethionine:tRNA ribosyltransferase-isomerase|nr:tRNA preQ1(34) S-adenosylmethionine ribosyltransferase-isomerase QueA [Bacteroidota bacterium]
MKLSEFDFSVPEKLVAQYPAEPRDASRMMVVHRESQTIEHRQFKDILEYFGDGDVLIMNDSKVFPARLYGSKEKTGAKIEVFLLRELNADSRLWDVVVDPARKIRVGNKLFFGDNDLVAEVVDNTTSRGRTIRFLFDGTEEDFYKVVDKLGETPLPDYIKRPVEPEDRERYQTVFARHKGSVAAPESGFHFSREVLKRLELQGVEHGFVTLHTGLGSFREVEVEDLSKHKMDSETYIIGDEIARLVNAAKQKKKKVCAVGATTMRAIESSVSAAKLLNPSKGWTDKFIFPPYDFSISNCFLTNLNPPKSTVVMMAAAFMGYEFMLHAYQEAVKEKYRFYCYGDAMLIL